MPQKPFPSFTSAHHDDMDAQHPDASPPGPAVSDIPLLSGSPPSQMMGRVLLTSKDQEMKQRLCAVSLTDAAQIATSLHPDAAACQALMDCDLP